MMNKYQEIFKDFVSSLHESEHESEDIKALKEICEKATPKKLIETILYEDEHHFVKGYKCPRCGDYKTSLLEKYCSECGQKLKEWM